MLDKTNLKKVFTFRAYRNENRLVEQHQSQQEQQQQTEQ